MKKSLICMGIGAGLMYLLDPELGPVRRSLLKDRFQELLPQTNDALMSKAGEVVERAGEITERADSMAAEAVQSVSTDLPAGLSNGHSSNGSSGNDGHSNDKDVSEPAS